MLSAAILVAAHLLAAGPIAPRQSEAVVVLRSPRTDLPVLREFLTEASAYAPMLNPGRLGSSLSGPLQADLLDASSLEAAGVSLDAPITFSFGAGGSTVCLTAKGKTALQRLDSTLGATTPPAKLMHASAKLAGAAVGKTWRAGYASRGDQLCIASDQPDALAQLKAAAEALSGKGIESTKAWTSAMAGQTGTLVAFVHQDDVTVALELKPSKTGMTGRGRLVAPKQWLDRPRDADPLATFAPAAPIAARAILSPKLVADPAGPAASALGFVVSMACPSCDASVSRDLHAALAPKLSGSVAALVSSVDPTAAGQPRESYFLSPHAYVLGLKDAAGARQALLAAVDKMKAAGAPVVSTDADGLTAFDAAIGPRHLFAGISGSVLYIANDPSARVLALAAAKAGAGKAAHAASAIVDGPAASAALRKISVFDVTRSTDLAALYAVALQAGPLLRASKMELSAEPEGTGARLELTWTLKPAPSIAPPAPQPTSANPP